MKKKMTLEDRVLKIKAGRSKYVSLPLDALRCVFMIFPSNMSDFNFLTFSSLQTTQAIHLDLLSDEVVSQVFKVFSETMNKEKLSKLDTLRLCLIDYDDNSAVLTLKDFKHNNIDIFEKLLEYRPERINRLKSWLENNPEVVIKDKGIFTTSKTIFNKKGVWKEGRNNQKDLMIAWDDVNTMQMDRETKSLYLLPKGVSGGMLSFKKHKYAISVNAKNEDRIYAECQFWRQLNHQKVQANVQQETEELKETYGEKTDKLTELIKKYESYGYQLSSPVGEKVIMERDRPSMKAIVCFVWLCLCIPILIMYVLPNIIRKSYRVELHLQPDGQVIESGGNIAKLERDRKRNKIGGLFLTIIWWGLIFLSNP